MQSERLLNLYLTRYYAGDQIKNGIGGTCGTYGGRDACWVLEGKTGGNRPLERLRSKGDIKIVLKKYVGKAWCDQVQDKDKSWCDQVQDKGKSWCDQVQDKGKAWCD